MARIVGVRFKKVGKIYYFSPDDLDIKVNDNVIVETARGIEFGTVVVGIRDIPDEELIHPLKKVLRVDREGDPINGS
jgi:cell fate regulator YaaT (PSP1 superfamily)